MEHYLRDWREDAARKSQHETAVFVGDKILALTSTHDSTFSLLALLVLLIGPLAR